MRRIVYIFPFQFQYTCIFLDEVIFPIGINHGNLFNKLIYLVQGRYGVIRAEVNGTGVVVGDDDGNVSGSGRCGSGCTG